MDHAKSKIISNAGARAISWLWMGIILSSACALTTQITLAKWLGPEDFGAFFASLTLINICTLFIAFGAPVFWLKAFAEEGESARRWIVPTFKFAGCSGLLVVAAIAGWVFLQPKHQNSSTLTLVLLPLLFSQASVALLSASYQLESKFKYLAILESSTSIIRLIAVSALIYLVANQVNAMGIAVTYSAIATMTLLYCVKKLAIFVKPDPKQLSLARKSDKPIPAIQQVFKESWQYGAAALLYLISYQVDIVLIKHLSTQRDAGLYGAAFLIVGSAYILPGTVFQKYFLPKLHKWGIDEKAKIKKVITEGTVWMALIGAAVSIFIYILAPFAIKKLFGTEYQESVPIVNILLISIPIKFMSINCGATLTAGRPLTKKLQVMFFATLFNIVANSWYIPKYGPIAAAWITLFTEIIIFALLFNVGRQHYLKPRG